MELLVLKLYQHASCSLISEKAYEVSKLRVFGVLYVTSFPDRQQSRGRGLVPRSCVSS